MEKVNVAAISSAEEAVNPTTQITLSNGDFQSIVELRERDESWLLKPIFPSGETLALLAHLAYEDHLHQTVFSSGKDKAVSTLENSLSTKFSFPSKSLDQSTVDGYQPNLNQSLKIICEEWQLLTTARNESDGYFGAAFWNRREQQLVFSHRGTNPKDINALLADIEGIIRNRHNAQIDSACTFVEHVLRELSHKKRFKQIQISITGHSLGAWLAQVTAFSTEYLTIDHEINRFRVKGEDDLAYHAHTVGFESPGCRRMLTKLCEMFHRRYENPDHNFWTNLDITLYLTRPNMVNTCCKHVGTLYQIDIPPFEKKFNWLKVGHYASYVIHYHSINNIVMTMSNNNNRVRIIHDWPLVIFAERLKGDGCKQYKYLDYSFIKLIKSLPSLIYDYIVKSNREVDEFWECANNDNSYTPETNKNMEYGIKLHYKVRDVGTSVCHLNTFSKVEKLFLFCWRNESTLRFNLREEIKKELPNFKLNNHDSLFENFLYIKNDCKQIKCENFKANELINFTKQLFRFIDEPKNFVQNLARVTQTSVSICKKFSDCYVRRAIVEHLDFKVVEEFERFLSSNEFRNVFVIKTRFKFEIQKIHSILRVVNKSNTSLFLDLMQLTHLNDHLYLSETIKAINGHVLVLDCQQTHVNDKNVNLLTTLLVKAKKLKTFVVIQSDLAEIAIKSVLKNDVKFVERDAHLYFSDLTPESNQWLRNMITDKILLQGKKLNLFNNSMGQIEALDGDVVAELIKKNQIFEIGNEPMKLCQSEAAYAKRLKFIQVETLIKAFHDDSNESKREIFLITSSNEINFHTLLHSLRIEDDEVERQKIIGECTNILLNFEKDAFEYNMSKKINILPEGKETHFKSFCYHNSEKTVYWVEIINEQFFLHQIFDAEFYVKRHLHHSKSIKNDAILNLSLNEKFVINASSSKEVKHFHKNDNNPNIFISPNENKSLKRFNDWCDNSSVHFLKVNDKNRMIWQQSHFSISKLRNYLDASFKQEMDEQDLANLKDNVVIIVAEPGMGKSTTLTRLSEYKLRDNWVIRLNLKDHQDQIVLLPDDYSDGDQANRAVVKFLMNVSLINCKLTEILLKFSLERQISLSLLLLFDGYDEIDEVSQRKLMRLLKYSKVKRIAQIWITSRQEFTQVLEDQFCVFSTTFKELTLDERQNFLKYFWQVRLKLELSATEYNSAFGNDLSANKFKVFSTALLEKVYEVLDERMAKFMGIPLQMRLLAENFLPNFERFVKSRRMEVPQFNELNVTQIYQRFVKIKLDIYFEEKSRLSLGLNEVSTKWFSSDLIKRHQYIAIHLLFPYKINILLELDPSLSEKDLAIDENEEIGLKRIGLIHCPDPYSSRLEFIHRTFAEYFVSNLILNWLRKPVHPKTFEAIDGLVKLVLKKFEVICSFLNEQISEADVKRTKTNCFGSNIFDFLDIACRNNHVNLIKLVLSFFTNKSWILERCTFQNFFVFALKSPNPEIIQSFLTLTTSHYDILYKLLFRPKYYVVSKKYKLKNNAGSIFKKMEHGEEEKFWSENVKKIMSRLKFRVKFINELVTNYYLPDLLELFQGEDELCQFMLRLKGDKVVVNEEEDEINRLVNAVRDKNVGNENEINRILFILEDSYREDDENLLKKCMGQTRFLYDFKDLINEDKPRMIRKKFQSLHRIFHNMNRLASAVERLKDANFYVDIVSENEDLVENCYHWESAIALKGFKYKKDLCKFLILLKNDEEFQQLLQLLETLNYINSITGNKDHFIESTDNYIIFDDDYETILKMLNSSSVNDCPELFLSLKYYNDKIMPSLHEDLNGNEERKRELFRPNFWLRNEFPNFNSFLQTLIPEWFLVGIECAETKSLLTHFLPILTITDFILTTQNIHELCQILWHYCLTQQNSCANEEKETDRKMTFDVGGLKYLLKLLAIGKQKQFYAAFEKMDLSNLEKLLIFSVSFPGLFLLLIFKLFRAKHSMYTSFSEEKIYQIFEFGWKSYPHIICCLLTVISSDQNNHLVYLLKNKYLKLIHLIFKILRPFPDILGHLILFHQSKRQSCLHYAIVESPVEALEHFLSQLRRNAKALTYVVQHFASNQEEKLRLFQVAEVNNPGALLRFLNSLKIDDELLKNFLLPTDKNEKPAFYLAGEKGCKEVLDTLLRTLKSEPDTLWELLVWAEPETGQTVLHRAAHKGYVEVVEAGLKSIKNQPKKIQILVEMKDKFGRGILDGAILSERQIINNNFNKNLRQDFIDNNINYKFLRDNNYFQDKQTDNLLKLSVDLQNVPMVVQLILILAECANNVELMLAMFENVDLKLVLESMFITLSSYSYRLFKCAIRRNSLELAKDLIEKGAEVNCSNGYGATPLMRAVRKNRSEIAEWLMKMGGADVYVRDMHGTSAISLANDKKDNKDVIKLQ